MTYNLTEHVIMPWYFRLLLKIIWIYSALQDEWIIVFHVLFECSICDEMKYIVCIIQSRCKLNSLKCITNHCYWKLILTYKKMGEATSIQEKAFFLLYTLIDRDSWTGCKLSVMKCYSNLEHLGRAGSHFGPWVPADWLLHGLLVCTYSYGNLLVLECPIFALTGV